MNTLDLYLLSKIEKDEETKETKEENPVVQVIHRGFELNYIEASYT